MAISTQVQMLLSLEEAKHQSTILTVAPIKGIVEQCGEMHKDVFEAFTSNIQGMTKKIPEYNFDILLDNIFSIDFHDKFDFDHSHDWESFETFNFEIEHCGFLIEVQGKVNYESFRSELINEVRFSIDWITEYYNDGSEIKLDHVQAEMLQKAVESRSYKI